MFDELVKVGWLKVCDDVGCKDELDEVIEWIEKFCFFEFVVRVDFKGFWVGFGGFIIV